MKAKKKQPFRVYGKKDSFSIAVGRKYSTYAVAWFWNTPGENAMKNAQEYVEWKNASEV